MTALTLLAFGFAVVLIVAVVRSRPQSHEKAARIAAFIAWCAYAAYEGIYIREWLTSVRGAPIRIDLIPIAVLLAWLTKCALWTGAEPKSSAPASAERSAGPTGTRICQQCGYVGPMKPWLRNYNAPQLAALGLSCLFLLPGILFMAWAWGKHKCPQCGAVSKNYAA